MLKIWNKWTNDKRNCQFTPDTYYIRNLNWQSGQTNFRFSISPAQQTLSELTRENVGSANAENFIAFRTSGFCERAMPNRKSLRKSVPHGQSICWSWCLSGLTISPTKLSFIGLPSQLQSYNLSAVSTLCNVLYSNYIGNMYEIGLFCWKQLYISIPVWCI